MRGKYNKLGEGKHNKLGEGERKVRLGQDSLPNIAISVAETIYVVLPGPRILQLPNFFASLYNWGLLTIGQLQMFCNVNSVCNKGLHSQCGKM